MNKKILLVRNYVIVENEDDLFFVFDTEYLQPVKSNKENEFNLETKKYFFIFEDLEKVPFEKIKALKTVGIVINEDRKQKQHILEGFVNYKNE